MPRVLTISLVALAALTLVLPAATEEAEALKGVRSRAAAAPPQTLARAEKRFDAALRRVADEAARPRTRVGEYLATELGIAADRLAAERAALGATWGDLMAARTLLESAALPLAPHDLLQLRREGLGWAAIAAGLDLDADSAAAAAHEESRVAIGMIKADGRVAAIARARRPTP